MKKVNNWRKQFSDDYPSFKKPSVDAYTERTYYYRDLKNTFWYGSEKDFAKSYYDAVSYIDSELIQKGFTSEGYRRKQARQDIERSLKTLNPANLSVTSKGRVMSKKREFLNYLKRYDPAEYRRAIKAEKEYNYKIRRLLAVVNKSKYKLRYSPYYDRY